MVKQAQFSFLIHPFIEYPEDGSRTICTLRSGAEKRLWYKYIFPNDGLEFTDGQRCYSDDVISWKYYRHFLINYSIIKKSAIGFRQIDSYGLDINIEDVIFELCKICEVSKKEIDICSVSELSESEWKEFHRYRIDKNN